MLHSRSLVLTLLLAAACGADDPPPDATGEGSATLRVNANIIATPLGGEHAADPASMETSFIVDVRDSNNRSVDGAVVIVESETGAVTLHQGGGNGNGCGGPLYCGAQAGYARVYDISVTRGADVLDSVHFTGPAWHDVTAPASGAVIDSTLSLAIAWSPSGEADETDIEAREYDTVIGKDPGAFDLPPDVLRIRDDRDEDELIRVTRYMSLDLTGGLPDSTLTIGVRNGVSFFTAKVLPLP